MKVSIIFTLLIIQQISQGFTKNTKLSSSSTFCKGRNAGLYQDPNSCDKFFQCDQTGQTFHKQCPKGTWFDASISVCNHINAVTCKVTQTVPSKPRSLNVVANNSYSIRIQWMKPSTYSKPLRHYQVTITRSGSKQSLIYIAQPNNLRVMIFGVLPGSKYSVEIKAVNSVGIGKPAIGTVTTPFNMPSKPRSLNIIAINSTTIQVQWAKPSHYTKPLRNYQITLTRSGSKQSLKYTAAPNMLSLMITSLLPGSKYSVEINAVNSVGIGKPAIGTVTTPFNIPPPPFIVSAKAMDQSTISLKWKDPILNNDSILNYVITYGKAGNHISHLSLRLSGYAKTAVIKHLQPGTEYKIRVQAITFGAYGEPAIVTVKTTTGDLCPQGYHSKTGKKPCQPCMYGSYQQVIGKTSCIKCPAGTTTLIKGAQSKAQCANVNID